MYSVGRHPAFRVEQCPLFPINAQVIDHEISAHQDKGSRIRRKTLNDDELSDSYDTNETLDEDTPLAKQVIDDTGEQTVIWCRLLD